MSDMSGRIYRFPSEVVDGIDRQASRLGVTANDFVLFVLRKYFELPRDPSDEAIDLLKALAAWVRKEFDPKRFPQNVTKVTFEHLQSSPALMKRYEAAISGDDGKPDERARGTLHRRIGKMVKAVLNATVTGRSTQLDREKHLIESYTFLAPTGSSQNRG